MSRAFVLAIAAALLGGCVTLNTKKITPRPLLEIDGRKRAIRVACTADVNDENPLHPSANLKVEEWRSIVGNAFVYALRETYVVVDEPGPEVLELVIRRAVPVVIVRGNAVFAQVEYAVRLETDDGTVLARAAAVAEGPRSAINFNELDALVTSSVEEMVRQVSAKVLPSVPAAFPASDKAPRKHWTDSARQPK